jgi:hypothetical protein
VNTDGNLSAIRNQLTYWPLGLTVKPQFQRLLKIEHRCLRWVLDKTLSVPAGTERFAQAGRNKTGKVEW